MQTSSLSGRSALYAAVTAKVVAAMEAGAGLFVMPWHRMASGLGRPTNALTGRRYRGSNAVALWAESRSRGYRHELWATYRQWMSRGAQVRKGERGSLIMFFQAGARQSQSDEDAEENVSSNRSVARTSWVFNVGQVDGWTEPVPARPRRAEVMEQVAAFIVATGATIHHGFEHACYDRRTDVIELPEADWFEDSPTSSATESYYSTVLHELTHWSGAETRLHRVFGTRYGDRAYAFEELVAELGAAFLCADLSVTNEPRRDHAAYLTSWLKILRDDPGALMRAAHLADEAATYLNGNAARAA